ncbi:MAG: hypothetical protein IT445_00640 [Phycisphaeraceae bacterium]|nr:hypothetical protein [Phycisphaeraceae bacterium]
MNRCLLIVTLTVLASASLVLGQEVPFEGVVVQDDVQVRCGAGMRYYVVGSVAKGAKVRVDEVFYGWNKIVPPEGVFSYISKAFVDAKGDGKVGEVTADGQEVKAASLQAPGESWRVQAVLDKGATVQIIEEVGSYYKIVPPKGAYVFLPPGSVQRADQVPPEASPPEEVNTAEPPPAEETPALETPLPGTAETGSPAVAPTEPATPAEPVTEAPTTPEPIAATRTEAPAIESAPAAEEAPAVVVMEEKGGEPETVITNNSLAELEKQTLPLFLKPVDEQPIDQMLAAYQGLDQSQMTGSEKLLVAQRIAVLKRNEKLAATLKQFEAEKKQMAEEAAAAEASTLQKSDYDLVGTLMASAVYSGETLPRLYRVIAGDGRTIAWVQPTRPVDAHKHLGKLVGIQGKKQYDDALKLDIYSVKRIDLLEASE